MPNITVEILEGRTDEQKAEISEVFKKELSRILNGKHGEIKVTIKDLPRPAKSE